MNRQHLKERGLQPLNEIIKLRSKTPIVILGTGGIAQKVYFPLLSNWENISINCIFSRTQERVDNNCRRWNISNGTTNLNDLIASSAKAAFVLTNKESHYKIIKKLLENGVDVYTEKPLAQTSQQAFELAELAQEKERILMVGFNRRFALLYQQAKDELRGKNIQLIAVQKHRTNPAYRDISEYYLEDCIHQIDLLRYFAGDVVPLETHYQIKDKKLQSTISTVALSNGGLGTILSAHTAGIWQESVTIHAENQTIHVDAFRNLWVRHDDHEELYGTDRAGKWTPDLKERGFIPEIDHFFQCVQSHKEPSSNAFEAAKTQQLMENLVSIAQG